MPDVVGGSVVWNLDVDKQKLTSGLADAKQQVATFADNAEKRFQTMASSIHNSMKQAERGSQIFAGGLAAIGAGLGFAVKAAGEMEMLRSSLDTLTGSAEKGAKVFTDLNKFAASTPFETTDLAKATETMLAFGITSDKVMPNLQMLGDISLGNAEKLSGLSLAFSQVQSTGRLMGQDLLQMINQGFNPLTIISQKTGKSMAVLKDEMAAGSISAEMVADAMKTATSEGGLFYKGMERGAQTLTGVTATLQDTIGMTIRQMVGLSETGEIVKGGLVDIVKNAFVDLTNFLTENQDTIVNFFNSTLGWIQANGPIVAGIIIGGLTPAVYGLATAFITAMTPLIPFIVAGALLGATAKLIVDALGGWEQAQAKVAEALSGFVNAFNTHVKPALDSLWKTINEELMPALRELWNVIGPVLGPVLKTLATIVGGIVIVALRIAIEVLKGLILWITDTVKNWTNLVNSFKGIPQLIGSAMRGVYDEITRPFRNAYETVKGIADGIKWALDKISPYHRNSPSLVDNVRSGVSDIISEYKSLKNITMPSLSGLAPALEYQPAFSSVGTDFGTETSSGRGNQYITFEEVNVNDQADIDSITRELGFMSSITPGVT